MCFPNHIMFHPAFRYGNSIYSQAFSQQLHWRQTFVFQRLRLCCGVFQQLRLCCRVSEPRIKKWRLFRYRWWRNLLHGRPTYHQRESTGSSDYCPDLLGNQFQLDFGLWGSLAGSQVLIRDSWCLLWRVSPLSFTYVNFIAEPHCSDCDSTSCDLRKLALALSAFDPQGLGFWGSVQLFSSGYWPSWCATGHLVVLVVLKHVDFWLVRVDLTDQCLGLLLWSARLTAWSQRVWWAAKYSNYWI